MATIQSRNLSGDCILFIVFTPEEVDRLLQRRLELVVANLRNLTPKAGRITYNIKVVDML